MFAAYLKEILIPKLSQGMTLILDNPSWHKSKEIRAIIEKAGCQLSFLPTYSPDLNPIEHFWFHIKNKVTKVVKTFDSFADSLSHVLKVMTSEA